MTQDGSPTSVLTMDEIMVGMTAVLKVELEPIKKQLDRLEKRTSILVEEKGRQKVRSLFGDNFSKRLLIKSTHQVMQQISKANDKALPKEYGGEQINEAVEKVAVYIQRFAKDFLLSAYLSLTGVVENKKRFPDKEFYSPAEGLKDVGVLLFSKGADYATICGKLIGLVAKFGKDSRVGEETEMKKKERVKMTTGTFKRKLERLQVGFTCDGTTGYKNCSGPGIMICCELSEAPRVEIGDTDLVRDWIQSESKIENWNEEVECDVRGSVVLIRTHATLSTGEIKCSMTDYAKAKEQMKCRLDLIEFILQLVLDNRFEEVVKKGHFFVLDVIERDQRNDPTSKNGVSIFLHSTDI
jgi:hypothetical protein